MASQRFGRLEQNYIINGSHDFFQRSISAVNLTTSYAYNNADRFVSNYSGTVTNVYAFSGNIASGTGRWNFFANGTANNYMAGRLGVGLGLTSGAMAQVVNTTAADKAFIIRGAAAQSGDFLDVQNSGGTSQFKITSNGDTNIGTTNVYSKVHSCTSF